jgi:hypothetical protein
MARARRSAGAEGGRSLYCAGAAEMQPVTARRRRRTGKRPGRGRRGARPTPPLPGSAAAHAGGGDVARAQLPLHLIGGEEGTEVTSGGVSEVWGSLVPILAERSEFPLKSEPRRRLRGRFLLHLELGTTRVCSSRCFFPNLTLA